MRKTININQNWAFSMESTTVPSTMPANWLHVSLPHSWNSVDGQDGGGDYYRGKCLYAKKLTKTDLPDAEEYWLEIKGANSSATVHFNGEKIASHDGGYSTWRVRLPQIQNENLLVVEVDNSPNDHVYPQKADFTFYGGLYRDVDIICVGHSHFDLSYHGSPGIQVISIPDGKDAYVEVRTWHVGEGSVEVEIFDREGSTVAKASGDDVQLTVKDAHLWNGVKDPYLYRAVARLVVEGRCVDEVSTAFGVRTFCISPEEGFFLNGEPYPLHGVSRHQDRWGMGNALTRKEHDEDMDLICELGANTIRLAHYQHDQYFYDLCDQRGMVVWAEIPYISGHMPEGRDNTVSQMTELIVQNINHPSIVVWGLSNEITINGSSEDLLENHRILNDLAHNLDRTRLTAMAVVSMCPTDDPYIKVPDVISYNHYFGWYGGDVSQNGPWFDSFHEKYPDIPIGISEYGAEGLWWHSSKPIQGDYSEEYQAYYHEEMIRQLFSRKYIWATHVWNMFDFGADARSEGGENGQNHKGLVTFDRKYKKDAFYAYKAWLSKEPFVHLCSKGFVDRTEDEVMIKVYSNQEEVELYANGVLVGTRKAPDHFFSFTVRNEGETHLVAKSGTCTDESWIRKVEKENESYRLKEKGAILNWFDITSVEGKCCLNDKLGQLLDNPHSKPLMDSFLARLFSSQSEGGMMSLSDGTMQMMRGFSVIRLLSMAGTLLGHDAPFSKEDLLDLNAKLNQIDSI